MLLTINKKYPPEMGGVEVVSKELAEIGLEYYGNSEVICFNLEFKNNKEEINKVLVNRLKALSLSRSVRIPFGYRKILKDKSLKASKIIYHFPSFVPEIVLPDNIVEKICLYHADVVGKGFVGDIYNNFFVKRFLDSMDKIIVTSPKMAQSSKLLIGRKNVSVIPLGVDVNHFRPEGENLRRKITENFNGRENDKIILFVGRIARYKGLDILIKSVSKLPEKYKLIIVTNDNSKGINGLIVDLNLDSRVKIYKGIGYDELPKYYRAADVFCMPSTDRGEAFGLVALEAMACGIPIITTELGTGTSYHNIDGVTGRIIEAGNVESLKNALVEILDDNLYDFKTIRERALEFSLENFKERWNDILKNKKEVIKDKTLLK